jgi:hypothetical protein
MALIATKLIKPANSGQYIKLTTAKPAEKATI